MQRSSGETRREERRSPWILPFFSTGDGSQTFYTYIADEILIYDEEEEWQDQDGQPFSLLNYTTDNQATEESESAGFLVIKNMERIQQGLNLIYQPTQRYQESLRGAYYGNLLPPMEVDGKKFHTLLLGPEAEVARKWKAKNDLVGKNRLDYINELIKYSIPRHSLTNGSSRHETVD